MVYCKSYQAWVETLCSAYSFTRDHKRRLQWQVSATWAQVHALFTQGPPRMQLDIFIELTLWLDLKRYGMFDRLNG